MYSAGNKTFRTIATWAALGIAVIAASALLVSCATASKSTVKITLTASAGTGYEWVNDIDQQQALTLADSSTESNSELAGGPVKSTYTLKAEQEGTATITFKLSRPWEPSADDQYTTYEFSVDKNKNVTFIGSLGSSPDVTAPEIS